MKVATVIGTVVSTINHPFYDGRRLLVCTMESPPGSDQTADGYTIAVDLVDAGVGCASDAAIAMELGCDGVLMNTAIAGARDPILMASAMKKAIEAGRESFLAGRIPRKRFASASSPVDGTFF